MQLDLFVDLSNIISAVVSIVSLTIAWKVKNDVSSIKNSFWGDSSQEQRISQSGRSNTQNNKQENKSLNTQF